MSEEYDNNVPDAPSPRQSHIPHLAAADRGSQVTRPSELLDAALQEEELDEKPIRCAKFRQQELWAWKPVWSPQVVVVMYLIVAVVFIPVGVLVFVQSSDLFASPRYRYDNVTACDVNNQTGPPVPKTCTIRFTVEKNVTAPAYFYYGLVNFYQNARTYVTSRSDEQLRGKNAANTGTCDPLEKNPAGNVIVPCGLIANSFFNDSFQLCRDSRCQQPLTLNSTGIAWDVDRDRRFLGSDSYTDEENALITSEDFMVWMRLATYRNWKKLYRIIETDMPAGEYFVRINANYPVESFKGEKFFFLSETSWFGGPNQALGICYIAVGAAALLVAISFAIRARLATNMDLPAETTVNLDGFVKHPLIIKDMDPEPPVV